jgi:hypothetical protein
MENNVDSAEVAEVASVEAKTQDLPVQAQENKTKKPKMLAYGLAIATIVTVMSAADCFIAPCFFKGTSFMWITFISWTLFSGQPKSERMKAIIGYIIGYFAANGMVWLANSFEILTKLQSPVLPMGFLAVGFVFNMLIAMYGNYTNKFLNSIPAMFLGLSFTFSGVGVGFNPGNLSSLVIIIIYGMMGVLACFACDFCAKKFIKSK